MDNSRQIDFAALLVVVKELDDLRFRSLLTFAEADRLILLQKKFHLITDGRRIPPKRFVSDGCTLSTDLFGKDACELHDLAYWLGGTRAERLAADCRLRKCTRQRRQTDQALVALLRPIYAPIQFTGVRVGGHPSIPDFMLNLQFRWAFGWEYGFVGEPGLVY